MRTWDDIPGWIEEHVTDRQREVVNRMRRQGYDMGNVWPDLDYEALDRIIFCMERKPREGWIEQAFVDREAQVNGKELEVYLRDASGNVEEVKKDPPVIYPNAPENYELSGVDTGFLREHSLRVQEALACLRLAAAINGGPPSWITRYFRDDVVCDGDTCYTEWGRAPAEKHLTREVNWKMGSYGGNRCCAELGHLHEDGRPCVVILWFEMAGGSLARPLRRRVYRLSVDEIAMIREVYCFSSEDGLQGCEMTGRRPALKDELPYE
jgi:hypothetical protein